MSWFRRRDTVQIRFTLHDKTYFAHVPPAVAAYLDERNTEATETAKATKTMADAHHNEHLRMQERIARHLTVKADLYRQIDEAAAAVRGLIQERDGKQAELDRALAEVKSLHATLAEVDRENLRLGGLLATAQEQIAGYRLGVGS